MTKTKPYFTLVRREGNVWSPVFGDYDKRVVIAEMAEMAFAKVRVIKHLDTRRSYIDALSSINAGF